MAKGSKAWYERYEKTIYAFEMDYRNIENRAKPYAAFQGYDMVKEKDRADVNSSLFSMNGGAYSPSKINIAIGQISASIYLITCIVHTVSLFQIFNTFSVNYVLNSNYFVINSILIFTPILIITLLLIWHCGWLKSSCIEEEDNILDFTPIETKVDNESSNKEEIDRLKSNYYHAYIRVLKFIKEAPDGTIILTADKKELKVTSALFNMLTYLIDEQNRLFKKNKNKNRVSNDTISPIINFRMKSHDDISIKKLNKIYNLANKWF
ncbi:hypothetical protein [uncultured Acetobacteroides sp.]|uniref:hypothetical protein n=1 Tax=uncultured Acetobacteroides sp. TaxID=1760811 RepID=UPI0029F5C9CE|nr:hypothetical protein [uncultured Acetobacteroides sp.]